MNEPLPQPPAFGHPYRDPPRKLVPPPRIVPREVRLRLLFGGRVAQSGWAWFACGVLVCATLAMLADVGSLWRFRGAATARGKVTAIDPSATYTFTAPDGVAQTGVSYTDDQTTAVGSIVEVEFLSDRPGSSRIVGTETRGLSAHAFIVLTLGPLIGLGIALWRLARGRRALRLLALGRTTRGTLVAKRDLGWEINDRTVYELTFEFVTEDGRPARTKVRTTDPAPLEDEQLEQLVYDPFDPPRATLMDALPGAPRIADDGTLVAGGPWRRYVVLPAIGAAALVAAAIVVLLA